MESLVDDVNALVAPDLTTDGPEWCENCQALRKEIRKLQEEQGQNFGKLKQKIISTDMLIKKFKAKCEDYDILSKKMEEANKRVDKHMRQNSILETQLKAALLDVDPLRKNKMALETEVQEQRVKIRDLTDKVVAFEGTQRQYEYLTKTTSDDIEKLDAEKKELMHKLKAMETGKITREAAKEYKYEISNLKKENQKLSKNEARLDTKLKSALKKIETLSQALKDAKFSPVRRRRTTSNNSLLSPTKSPLKRSPRGRGMSPTKPSPSRSPRTRTLSGREIKFIPKEEEPDLMEDSDCSSDDQGSEYSMALMFSPLVKCLSPLPPSPVCYGNKMESDEDSNLSDMADELEQQLVETLGKEEVPADTWVEQSNLIPDNIHEEETKEKDKLGMDTDKADIDNDNSNAEKLFDLNYYEETYESDHENVVHSHKESGEDSFESVTEFVEGEHSGHRSEVSINNVTENKNNFHSSPTKICDVSKTDETPGSINQFSTTVLVKESQSTDNLQIAQKPECQTHQVKPDAKNDKNEETISKVDSTVTEITKDKACEKTSSSGTTNKKGQHNTCNSESDGGKNKDLPRTDTSEFVPVLEEFNETLSDSETETVTNDVKSVTNLPLPTCKGDASSVGVKVDDDKLVGGDEVEIEIEEQTEQVDMVYPPTRGLLKRQRNISSESSQVKGDKLIHEQKDVKKTDTESDDVFSPVNTRKKGGKKNKSYVKNVKNKFIAFQKSSSGTLAEEIEHMESDVTYECNDRSEIPTHDAVVNAVTNENYLKIKDKKLVHKIRYEDLDNFKDDNNVDLFSSPNVLKGKNKLMTAKAGDNTDEPHDINKVTVHDKEINYETKNKNKISDDNLLEKQNTEEEVDKQTVKENISLNTHRTGEKQIRQVDNNEVDKTKYRSPGQTPNGKNNTLEGVLISDDENSEHNPLEQVDSLESLCDTEIQNTLGTSKVILDNVEDRVDSTDANKTQPSRQLSTGFVVGSPYTDSLAHRKTPSDKDKHVHVKGKSKDTDISVHKSDHGLEQIQEEGETELLNDEENVTNSDKVSDNSIHETDQPGCSYHYKDPSEDLDNLHSSISLSQEIERILDKKPGERRSRIISCTPDMLDSGSAEFMIDNNSRSITPSEESVSRSPLSPLPISPFDFIDPISPLPPSPIQEIERVSPLSPDGFDTTDEPFIDKPESMEEDFNDFVSEENTFKTEDNKLRKAKSKILAIEAMSLPIPDALSPIKSPNQKLYNKKIKKGKVSAFQTVSKLSETPLKKDSGTNNEKDQLKQLEEETVNCENSKENKHDHSNKSQTSDNIKGKTRAVRKKSRDDPTKVLAKTDLTDTNTVILNLNTGKSKSVTDSSNSSVRLKTQPKKILSGNVEKAKGVEEDKVEDMKEEESIAEVSDVSSGQDNLAFKKKARLAHRPNIQALRPQRVQVIDIQALPTQTRKRKSLEAQDTDGKKQMKGTTFHYVKGKNSSVSKEDSKMIQTYLKSLETPDSFVNRVMEKSDSTIEKIFDLCIDCLGRVRTDTIDIVYSQCENEMYKTLDLQWPFLSDVEKQAVKLLQYLYTQQPQTLSYKTVMSRLWECIFGRNLSINVVGQMCYCRVFTALSSLQGDVEQARVLFYNVVCCGHLNMCQFVVPVVSVWPEVLRKGETSDDGLLCVLEEVVTKALLDQGLDVNKKILVILQKLCSWRGSCGQAETLLKSLLNKLESFCNDQTQTQDCLAELTKAIQLLSVCGGWAWFKEFFIMRHGLQSATNRVKAKNITNPISPTFVCSVLKITASVTSCLSETVPAKDIDLFTRNWMLPLLTKDLADSNVVQCCSEVLLELSPFLPSLLKGLNSWFVKQPHSVKKGEQRDMFEAVRKLYQFRLASFSCDPFV